MRIFICGLLLLISTTDAIAAQKGNTIVGLTLAIKDAKASGAITLQIDNSSQKPIRLWEEANSWGAAHWRVLLVRDGRLETFFENPDQAFTRNFPAFYEIAAGRHIERTLDIAGEGWRGLDAQKIRFERGDVLIVIYDVPRPEVFPEFSVSVEADKMGVWYGVATAMTTVR